MSKYEYKSIPTNFESVNIEKLNELGDEGWKLVDTLTTDGYTHTLIFIRKK